MMFKTIDGELKVFNKTILSTQNNLKNLQNAQVQTIRIMGSNGTNVRTEGSGIITSEIAASVAQPQTVSNFTKLNNAFNVYNNNLTKSTGLQNAYIKSVGTQNQALGNYLAGLKGAPATFGGYIASLTKAKLATIGLHAASIALNMALTMGVAVAISALFKGIDYLIHRTEKMQEALENSVSEFNSVTDELKSLEEELKTTTERLAELQKLADNGTISVAEEAELETLKKTNKELARKIALKQQDQAQEARDVLKDSRKNANSTVSSKYNRKTTSSGNSEYGVSVTPDEELELAIKAYETNSKALENNRGTNLEGWYEDQTEAAKNRIEEMYDFISPTIDAYEDLINASIELEGEDKTQYEQLKKSQEAYLAYVYTLNGTREAFEGLNAEQQRNVLLNRLVKQGLSEDVAKAIVGSISDEYLEKFWDKDFSFTPPEMKDGETAEEYGKRYAQAWAKGLEDGAKNAENITISVDDLEGASDNIKTLGSAFKELSDDGYITTKTLGEIQAATGLSGDEWTKYENKLINAKSGSNEFNQTLGELTYSILEEKIGIEKLADADSNYIATILRENGVLNANEVATSAIRIAKIKAATSVEALSSATSLSTQEFYDEVDAMKLTAETTTTLKTAYMQAQTAMTTLLQTNALKRLGMMSDELNGIKSYNDALLKVAELEYDGGANYANDIQTLLAYGKAQDEINKLLSSIKNSGTPNYSGNLKNDKSSKNDPKYSDPTDAIINRINAEANQLAKQGEIIESNLDLIDSEKDYAKAIDETNNLISNRTSQINALKLANSKLHNEAEKARNSNSYTNEESWFDADGDETEAFHELMNSIKTDDAQEKLQNEFNKIQKFKKAYLENEKVIQDLTKENIKSIEDISDIASEALENHFDERNEISERWIQTQTDFDQLAIDGQIEAYARMVRNNREFLKEIEKNEHLSAEERDRLWKETSDKIVDYQLEAYNLVKEAIQQYGEEVEKGYDIRISRLGSESSLLSTHFDLINAISEEQHNLNKELAEAEVAGAKMNKIERQTLFTKEEHAKLTDKLNGLLGDTVAIQSNYLSELETATKETIEEITNNYERQYELKMKEYEVVKAELALVKAEQKLKNVENEKSVRTWDGTKWVYEADFQDVVDAKLAVEDAKYAVWQAQTSQAQQNALNAIDSTADSLETQKNLFAETLEELSGETKITGQQLTEALKYIAEVDLPTFEKIIEQFGDSLSEAFDIDVDSVRGSAGDPGSSGMPLNSSHLNYSRTVAQMKANSAAYSSATPSEQAALHSQNASLAAGIGATFNGGTGHWEINGSKLYANGSKSTQKGLGIFDENGIGSEYVLTKDGILHNFNMGDKVFNPKMGDNLYEAAQIDWKKVSLADFGGLASIDNSIRNMSSDTYYNVNGVNINSEEGGEIKGFVKFLKAKKI